MRPRAAGLVTHNDKILLIYRRNKEEYFVFPGGGVEDDEAPTDAVLREIDEETSIEATVDRAVFDLIHDTGDVHHYFLCNYVSGEPSLRHNTGEYRMMRLGLDFYEPRWVPLSDLDSLNLLPVEGKATLLKGLKDGFPEGVQAVPAIARHRSK